MYSIVVGGALAVAAIAAVVVVAAAGGGSGGMDTAGGLPSAKQQFAGGIDPPPQQVTDLDQAAKAAGCVLKNPVIEGRTHIPPDTKVTYKTNPPTSGNHDPQPADDGVYSKPMSALETRHFVHTLEHGRIELQYDPTLPKHRLDQLGGLFNEDPYHMVLLPNRKMPYEIGATRVGTPDRLREGHRRHLRRAARIPRPLPRPGPRAGSVTLPVPARAAERNPPATAVFVTQ